MQQRTLMKYDPATGWRNPYPSHAEQWRDFNGAYAWLFNPWTGERRDAGDVGSDTFGHLIVPPGEEVAALTQVPEGAAVDGKGGIYYQVEKMYAQAEAAECVHMWLDEQGAPAGDAGGKYSLVGRIRALLAAAPKVS